ncbi:hypothetical protein RhiirB3_452427 [Rhizophagus irregularis]|nr:hypothetical protein RhiirB3_452427 [Rhizophagus irregularis]
MSFKCYLCQKTFSSRKQLLTHERTKHKNNKTIPHLHLLHQPTFEQLTFRRIQTTLNKIYEVSFSWAQNELVENNQIFQCGTVICTFTTDSGEFINGNEVTNENHTSAHSAIPTITKTNNQSQYRFILPRSPLQELNQKYQ